LDGPVVVRADYFDGRSTRVRAVTLSIVGQDLVVVGEDVDARVPFARITVDERLGRAPRRLRLEDGAFCEVRDLEALDALLSLTAHRDGRVDRLQRHLHVALVACVACVALAVVAYVWGLPWAAAEAARRLPPAVGRTLSVQALKVMDGGILFSSRVTGERQQGLKAKFDALRLPGDGAPVARLLFRDSPQLGANAFALPDGTIVVLDDLITSIDDDPEILAVLAHELGHVHGRHGLQLLFQSSAVGALATFYFGDISHLLAVAPAALVQARYSQALELEADDFAATTLRQHGMSPGLLADALKTLAERRPGAADGGYLSSHPPTDQRMRHLRQLAASFTAE
jgi:Zn-dependent protease with chaperone function